MGRIEEIDAEIERLNERLETVTGTETEVYSRIVGYYRSLRNWNRGKREEFAHRLTFDPASQIEPRVAAAPERSSAAVGETIRYELFVRETCPNCPPMKAAAEHLEVPGVLVDVDTSEGIERAVELSIYATPTIVFFDAEGHETSRATSAAEIREHVPAV